VARTVYALFLRFLATSKHQTVRRETRNSDDLLAVLLVAQTPRSAMQQGAEPGGGVLLLAGQRVRVA
jgi:hypothetical protein